MASSKKEGGINKKSRVSVKEVYGEIDDGELSPDKSTPIARFYGTITKYKVGEGKNGEWIQFEGSIRAINLATGEEFESRRLFLPTEAMGDVHERCLALISGEQKGVKKTNNLREALEFALDLGAYRDKSSPTNYLYEVHDLMDDGKGEAAKTATDRIGASLPAPAF